MAEYDLERVASLITQQEAIVAERQPRSIAFAERAQRTLAGGMACSWNPASPHIMYGARGAGAHLFDMDDNEYVDLHAGFGVMVAGHAHPKVVEAVRRRVAEGTHFSLATEGTVAVAELLAERFGLPLWRFENSGTEATMDAARIARAATGRDLIVKVEGCYHGSSDGLDFSCWPDVAATGPRERPTPVPHTAGVLPLFGDALRLVSMNDLPGLTRIFAEEGDRIAAMILEPIPLNMGVVPPDDGYLEQIREITRRHGALLIFDEVKTGATIAYGGAIERFGVMPDMITLAKAIGGGLPIGAVGAREDVMQVVADGTLEQEGTFNGNPLSMAAAYATLAEVLTKDVYATFDELDRQMVATVEGVKDRYAIPLQVHTFGARGGLQFRDERVRDYRDWTSIPPAVAYLEYLTQLNGGVFEPIGETWTISVAHTPADIGRWAENLETFAAAVTS